MWLNALLLTEAEEQCVHTHGVHAEEAMGDEVGSNYQRLGEENHAHQDLFCGTELRKKSYKHNCLSPVLAPSSSSEMELPPRLL